MLLEDRRLPDITVGLVAEKAGCNRGTFYYHYRDLDDLVYAAVEHELVGEGGLPVRIMRMLSGEQEMFPAQDYGQDIHRVSLLMAHGGMDVAAEKAKLVIMSTWIAVLAPDTGDIAPETRAMLEYMIGGMLSVIAYLAQLEQQGLRPDEASMRAIDEFARANSAFMFPRICEAQGESVETLTARLKTARRLACA